MSNRTSRAPALTLLGLAIFTLFCGEVRGQDLEPRRWTHLPTNLNVAGAAIALTDGTVLVDPVLKLEDVTVNLYTLASSYVRSFKWLGKSSRFDVRVPYANGRWEGLLDGEYASTRRDGFGDPMIRLSMTLLGSPPLRGEAFMRYRAEHPVTTSVGVGVAVTLPLGEYYADRLINLGGNRYVVRPQLGLLHQRGPWQFEVTTSVSLFEDNDRFFAQTQLEQEPLWFVQGHVIRSFARGVWGSLSGGFSYGGEAEVDGVAKDNDERTRFLAASVGMPLRGGHSIAVTYVKAETNLILGKNSDNLLLSWSLAWSR